MEKILSKIRKLMAIANDTAAGGEHERDTAMQMAYKLLAKHNLSLVDVDSVETQEKRDRLNAVLVGTVWSKRVAMTIAELFFCKYYVGCKVNAWKCHHYFIGKESNATTAMLMSEYVITSLLKEMRRLYKEDSNAAARSFGLGAVSKLSERVREIKAAQAAEQNTDVPGTALVLASLYNTENTANDEFLKLLGVHLSKGRSGKGTVTGDAYAAGKSFGEKINLQGQVGAGVKSTTKKIGG